jgi:hypothetical protein
MAKRAVDAYTYLHLNRDNEYGIKASIYDSKDFLKTPTQLAREAETGKIEKFFYKDKKVSSD